MAVPIFRVVGPTPRAARLGPLPDGREVLPIHCPARPRDSTMLNMGTPQWVRRAGYHLHGSVSRLRQLADDTRAQDLVEYALLAGFVATGTAGIFPEVADLIAHIVGHMASRMQR